MEMRAFDEETRMRRREIEEKHRNRAQQLVNEKETAQNAWLTAIYACKAEDETMEEQANAIEWEEVKEGKKGEETVGERRKTICPDRTIRTGSQTLLLGDRGIEFIDIGKMSEIPNVVRK
ncbi:MAG: hypothetical protein Q9209_005601 [Squamulea sp. 1 TL-2023]